MNAEDKCIGDLSPDEEAALNRRLEASMGPMLRRARAARHEAAAYYAAIAPLGYTAALRYVEAHPPSAECILALAGVGHAAMLKEQTRAGAAAANAPRLAAREWLVSEWILHADEWGRNKSKFARGHLADLKALHDVGITQKTVTDIWLRGK